ncbi:MAG: hypothetical protein SPI87_01490 [Anaerobutyricum sp.]|nr:hypothetical protein [Anaerobutyricum sp.]
MITFLYETVRKQKKDNKPYWKLSYKINKILVNFFFPLFQRWKKGYGLDAESRIIVSLTTYPERIGSVWLTIVSLLQQTMKPYKVVLWLAEEQFPQREIPRNLQRLIGRGLEIRFCEDLKPHKKYYDAIRQWPDYYIITADDDIFYPENHIEQLWKGHEKYRNSVICHWSHRIEFDVSGQFQPYNNWVDNGEDIPSYATLAVGCNGVLYPPGSLPEETFHMDKIRKNSLYTDDLWLKCMEILNKRKTVNCNEVPLIYFNVLSTKNTGLWKSNTGESRNNDIIWSRLMEMYPEVKSRLEEEREHDLFMV